jgi:uncharacterized protein (DUF983 family)
MTKGSKLYSILTFKCPHCQEGKFFVSHPYYLTKTGVTLKECPVCSQNYSPEPGFYFGAMYVSYALGVALFVTIWASCNWFFEDVSVWLQIGLVIGASILLGPLLYATSKIIWANFFIHYSKDAKHGKKEATHS